MASNEKAFSQLWLAHSKARLQTEKVVKKRILGECVLTAGWPLDVGKQKLYHLMSQYGKVHSVRVLKNKCSAIVRFERAEDAQLLIAKGCIHLLHKEIHTCSLHNGEEIFPTENPKEHTENTHNHSMLLDILKHVSFDEEIDTLLRFFRADTVQVNEKRKQVASDLENGLKRRFGPRTSVRPFGSTVIGLAFPDADLDFFVSLNSHSDCGLEVSARKVRQTAAWLRGSTNFAQIVTISHAHVPIVKCMHKRTQINCDISFKSPLGVYNSRLFKFLVDLDEKIATCLVVLKYWMRCHQLTGKSHRVSSYALYVMFLFYLQQPPINFPAIKELQSNRNVVCNIWNCGFDAKHNIDMNAIKAMALCDLLCGFFRLYAQFDFETMAISPYLGRSIDKACFESVQQVPTEFRILKENPKQLDGVRFGNLFVQDVFEHSRNVTAGVNAPVLVEFQNAVQQAVSLFDKQTEHLLFRLLDNSDENGNLQKICIKLPVACFDIFHICIKCVNLHEIQRQFFRIVHEKLMHTLRNVLQLNVAQQANSDSANERNIYECTGTFVLPESQMRSSINAIVCSEHFESLGANAKFNAGAFVIVTVRTSDAEEEINTEFEVFASFLRLYLPQCLDAHFTQLKRMKTRGQHQQYCLCKSE